MLVDLNIGGLLKTPEKPRDQAADRRVKRQSGKVQPSRRIEPLGRHGQEGETPQPDERGLSRYA